MIDGIVIMVTVTVIGYNDYNDISHSDHDWWYLSQWP